LSKNYHHVYIRDVKELNLKYEKLEKEYSKKTN